MSIPIENFSLNINKSNEFRNINDSSAWVLIDTEGSLYNIPRDIFTTQEHFILKTTNQELSYFNSSIKNIGLKLAYKKNMAELVSRGEKNDHLFLSLLINQLQNSLSDDIKQELNKINPVQKAFMLYELNKYYSNLVPNKSNKINSKLLIHLTAENILEKQFLIEEDKNKKTEKPLYKIRE